MLTITAIVYALFSSAELPAKVLIQIMASDIGTIGITCWIYSKIK